MERGDLPAVSAAPSVQPAIDAIAEIDHYELDDIPLFHLPTPGSTTLTLAFRVGRADEPVINGGLTHLAEHLVMTAVSSAFDHSNGMTEPFRVSFTLRGSPADASRFLRDICRAIESPPFRRMHEEANVLRTEAASRAGMGMSLRLTWFRTGFQGVGTFGLPELFLRFLDERVLRDWIATHFVAGNAAIWIAGDLPDDLEVSLPPGPRTPLPEVSWIPGLETPTFVVDETLGIGASFFVDRTSATSTAFRTLERHLKQALRLDRGLAYDVGGDYLPVGPDHAFANAWATCLPHATSAVERVILETIDDVAARGPTEDELAEEYQQLLRAASDPAAIPSRLDAHLRDHLLGMPSTSMAQLIDDQWRLRSDDVARAFRQARESMLLVLPPSGDRPQRPLKRYPGTDLRDMGRGRVYDLAKGKRRVPWGKPGTIARLTVADQGISIDAKGGRRFLGIRWSDCVAVIRDPDARVVLARDGTRLRVVASDWNDGRDALRMIDHVVPNDVKVPVAIVGG